MRVRFAASRRLLPALACAAALASTAIAAAPDKPSPDKSGKNATLADDKDKKAKPTISLKANPMVGFSPSRVVLTADVKGGANDFEEFYCASVEWDWGDDTRSESKADCDPYEAGKSEIRRRYTTDHVFNNAGEFRVEFRLKQKNKVVAKGTADVRVRPGLRDGGGDD